MKRQTIPAYALWATLALSGCATYSPAPIDPPLVLDSLEAIEWHPPQPRTLAANADAVQSQAVGPRELAAFAVSTNPQLAAVRAEVGVQRALLIEANLLPDPEIGWDAMDVLASQIVESRSSSVDALAGAGLMFPLLRPGERSARLESAEWRTEQARQRVVAAEWLLTRNIYLAYEELQGAEVLLAQSGVLTELAQSTSDYFQKARDAGAATTIQANLALGEFQAIRLDKVRVAARVEQAWQALNALLGLPPANRFLLLQGEDPSARGALQGSVEELTAHAVQSRPDLSELLASYEVAEQEVRLAVSKQFPLLSVGTGLSLSVPVFSRFGRPAIQTALAKREQVAREFSAAVHSVRQEISATHSLWQLATTEASLIETELLPNAEQNLVLSEQAFRAGEVTLLETLALQRALVEARTRRAEVRAEQSKRAWALLAASGWLLSPDSSLLSQEGSK